MQSSTENLPSANRNMLHGAPLNTQGSGASTKILYFTEKTVAPFACTIYKRYFHNNYVNYNNNNIMM